MKKFNIAGCFYQLPVFFLVLAGSPNIVGWRIGLVLASVYLLLMPSVNYMVASWGKRKITTDGKVTYSWIDFVALLMFILTIHLGWQINWQYNLLQVSFLFYTLLVSRLNRGQSVTVVWVLYFGLGLLLYAILFLGLNQYEFHHLTRGQNIVFALLSGLLVAQGLFIAGALKHVLAAKLKSGNMKVILLMQLLTIVSFTTTFLLNYTFLYAGIFILAMLPGLIMAVRLVKPTGEEQLVIRLKMLLLVQNLALLAFFFYFFLDSTQVLQAVMGGY